MPYVYSTATCGNTYIKYHKSGHLNVAVQKVSIKGCANLPIAGMTQIITPKGAVTEVTDEELEILENDENFKVHVEKGFMSVERTKTKVDKVVKNMTEKDESAPKTEKDLENLKVKEYKLDK